MTRLLFVILNTLLISLTLFSILIPMIFPFANLPRLIRILVCVRCCLFLLWLLMLRRCYAMCDCAAQDAYVSLQNILSSLPRETLLWLRDELEKECSYEG